jgi:hypothetical protein
MVHRLLSLSKPFLESIYSFEEIDYETVGKLTVNEFTAIINCVRNSRTAKREIRRALEAKI